MSERGIIDLFRMKEAEWSNTVALLSEYAGLQNAPKASQFFTNEFLPST